ncbi:hypothetical protein Golob_004699 [Gossypium lobatum]|uniref:Uncharacterized protein n=1 Tax=Gossypium lobatum TaxID=34289 RepID=A0A7J8N272_9ROSI|nr:hypothetical protein [Gossypium lobatum]
MKNFRFTIPLHEARLLLISASSQFLAYHVDPSILAWLDESMRHYPWKVDVNAQHIGSDSSAKANCSFKIHQSFNQAATWFCRCVSEINMHQTQQIKTHTEVLGIACTRLTMNVAAIREHISKTNKNRVFDIVRAYKSKEKKIKRKKEQ